LAHIKLIPQDARPFRLGPLAKTIESSGTQGARAFLWLREPKVVSSGQTRALIPFISNSNCGWVDPAGSFILNYLSAGRCTTATASNFIVTGQQTAGDPRTIAKKRPSFFYTLEGSKISRKVPAARDIRKIALVGQDRRSKRISSGNGIG